MKYYTTGNRVQTIYRLYRCKGGDNQFLECYAYNQHCWYKSAIDINSLSKEPLVPISEEDAFLLML